MVKPLQPGVRLTAIFDSCHSGSALDLPYIYSTQGVLKEPNLAKEAGAGLLSIVSSYARGDMGSMASAAMGLIKKATKGDSAYEKTRQTKTSPADVIMWSGSKDEQTSQDATINGQATGAMSWAFINALKKNPQQSYVQLLNSIRDELAAKYSQKPQLSCSHPLGKIYPFLPPGPSLGSGPFSLFLNILTTNKQIPTSFTSCEYPMHVFSLDMRILKKYDCLLHPLTNCVFLTLLTNIPAFSAFLYLPRMKLGSDLHCLLVGFAAGMGS